MERMDDFAAKYPQYADLMTVRESIYKLNRLQGLQYSVYMTEAEIAGYTNDQMTEYLTKLSRKGVNYGMETLGFGKNFYSINSEVVKQFVDVPWCNGGDFSTRIWNDTQKLAQYLSQDLAQGFARGDSYDKLVRNLRQRFGRVNRKDAYRLVYTEGTYVMAESTMQSFKDDFEQYRLSPVLDGRTCPICRGLREQVFLISERQPGVNFPPIHPWCRCSWEIVVDDWDAWMDEYVAKHSGDRKQAEEVAKRLGSGIIKSGAVSGARNPYGKAAEKHAKKYYGLVRSMKTDVQKIAKTTGYSETEIRRIKNYIFVDEHDLGERGRGRFDPDYMMAESWRRLIEGKPEAHDLTMLRHEIMEQDLLEQGFSQDEAHRMTSAKYNYDKEAMEFYGKIKKFKKE